MTGSVCLLRHTVALGAFFTNQSAAAPCRGLFARALLGLSPDNWVETGTGIAVMVMMATGVRPAVMSAMGVILLVILICAESFVSSWVHLMVVRRE